MQKSTSPQRRQRATHPDWCITGPEYRCTDRLPADVPAMLVDDGAGRIVVLVDEELNAGQVCDSVNQLLTAAGTAS